MIKKTTYIILSIVLLFVFTSCSTDAEKANSLKTNNNEIPILIQNVSKDGITASTSKWDITSGKLKELDPVYLPSNPTSLLLWDGYKNFVFEELPTPLKNKDISMKKLMGADTPNYTVLTDTIKVEVNKSYEKKTYKFYWNDKNDNEITKEPTSLKSPDILIEKDIAQNLELATAVKDNDSVILFFSPFLKEDICEIFYVIYNIQNDDYKWYSCKAPSSYKDSITVLFSTQSTLYNNKKLYMSGGESLLCLDIQKNEIAIMDDIIKSAKKLIPNTTQENAAGLTPPISLASCFNDIIIFGLPVYEKTGEAHATYFALKNDKFIGAMDIFNNNINFYNNNFVLINSIKQDGDKLSSIPVKFPWNNIKYYGNIN